MLMSLSLRNLRPMTLLYACPVVGLAPSVTIGPGWPASWRWETVNENRLVSRTLLRKLLKRFPPGRGIESQQKFFSSRPQNKHPIIFSTVNDLLDCPMPNTWRLLVVDGLKSLEDCGGSGKQFAGLMMGSLSALVLSVHIASTNFPLGAETGSHGCRPEEEIGTLMKESESLQVINNTTNTRK